MYSLVLLVCVLNTGNCGTVAPEELFSTKRECESAYFLAQEIAGENVYIDVLDGQCVNWGLGS